MGVEKHMQAATCKSCGASIDRHEPLVIVDGVEVRYGTLASELRPRLTGAAIYHPGCYGSASAELAPGGSGRVFAECG